MNSEVKICQNCKNSFIVEPEDFLLYDKMKVPPPTWCPECRMIRRFVWRNERNLYRVKNGADGEEIFSGVPPGTGLTLYDHDYWWSDKWDPMEYGRDYDFSKPFFEQFRELLYTVPWPSRDILELVNSEYSNKASYLKNCYLCFNSGHLEDSAYISGSWNVRNSFDLIEADKTELSYESLEVEDAYKTFFSLYCDQTQNVWFSRDLTGCSDCFGCVNLRNKQFHIFNKSYTREAYIEELSEMKLHTYSGLNRARKRVYEFWQTQPRKFYHGVQNVHSTGDCLHNTKNVSYGYGVADTEDSKYCQDISIGVKDSYDYTVWGENTELMYEALESGLNSRNVKFADLCWPAVDTIEYSTHCGSSSNLFACVGLQKKSYCIFNKQYSPEEYAILRDRIIRHMNEMPYTDSKGRIYRYGEFFPPEFSPVSYQDSIANDYFPLSREEAIERGYTRRDEEIRDFKITIQASEIPDAIEDVSDPILQEIIGCSSCGRPYRVIGSELQFLRAQGIPIPRMCIVCRYNSRHAFRNQPRYYSRKCTCRGSSSEDTVYRNQTSHFHGEEACPNEFITTFSSSNPTIVYCEQCYNTEVV